MDQLEIRNVRDETSTTQAELCRFIITEARKGTDSIGFIPYEGLVRRVQEGNVLVLDNNSDHVGFAVVGGKGSSLRVFQIWVRQDARLLLHGRALVDALDTKAARAGKVRLSLWCLESLPSVFFWSALGFTQTGTRQRSTRHQLQQLRFVRAVTHSVRELFPTT